MRILITNNTLDDRAGSEMYVRDIAIALLRRGHQPVAYSTRLGAVAQELTEATVPVIDDLAQLAQTPDIIHGQHHLDTMTAMLHFLQVPALYFCHGWLPWEEMPPKFPTLQHYVAVDDLCVERLQCEHGIAADRIHVIRNFVDLQRYSLRSDLPAKPKRALVFSNRAHEDGYLGVIRRACARRGIEVDVMGAAVLRVQSLPEKILGQYDIVFAKARSAMEALASGCAVIACDAVGFAGMVTEQNYTAWRNLNFGVRVLNQSITEETMLGALDDYDAAQARRLALRIRSDADMQPAISAIESLYSRVIADHPRASITSESPTTAASVYLRRITTVARARSEADQHRVLANAETTTQRLRAEHAELQGKETLSFLKTLYGMSFGSALALPLRAASTTTNGVDTSSPSSETWALSQRQLLSVQRAALEQDDIMMSCDRQRTGPAINTKIPFWRLLGRAFTTRNSSLDCLSARLKLLRMRNQPDAFIESLFDEPRAGNDVAENMLAPTSKSLWHDLAPLLSRLNAHSLVEIACGHCTWIADSKPGSLAYTGIDLAPLLIEQNRRRFVERGWKFEVADVVIEDIPHADVVLCRDWLDYLPLVDVGAALHHMRSAGEKYLIATNDTSITTNTETQTGIRRALNLMQAPFNMHKPIAVIAQDSQSGKQLAVWQLSTA